MEDITAEFGASLSTPKPTELKSKYALVRGKGPFRLPNCCRVLFDVFVCSLVQRSVVFAYEQVSTRVFLFCIRVFCSMLYDGSFPCAAALSVVIMFATPVIQTIHGLTPSTDYLLDVMHDLLT